MKVDVEGLGVHGFGVWGEGVELGGPEPECGARVQGSGSGPEIGGPSAAGLGSGLGRWGALALRWYQVGRVCAGLEVQQVRSGRVTYLGTGTGS